jgi:hypothetical protein
MVSLALDDLLQTPELLGVRVATGAAAQLFAFLGKGLLELNAGALGGADHLVASDLQKAAVHGVRDGLLLHRGVDDHPLQVFGLDGLDGHRRVDGGLEQMLQALFTEVAPKPSDLRGVARLAVFVVGHAAEELPQHVLAPAHDELFVAEVEAVLQVQQAGHQTDWELGATGVADARAYQHQRRAEHVVAFEHLAGALLALELGRHRRFDLIPRQPGRQHRQGIIEVDHRVDACAKEVGRLHPRIPQKSTPRITLPEGFGVPRLHKNTSFHAGWRGFAGPTM